MISKTSKSIEYYEAAIEAVRTETAAAEVMRAINSNFVIKPHQRELLRSKCFDKMMRTKK